MRFETLISMSLSAGLFEDEETQARTGPRENLTAPTPTRLHQTLEGKQGSRGNVIATTLAKQVTQETPLREHPF